MALSWRTSVLADRHRALGSKLEDWNGMGTAWTYAKDVAQDHVAIRTKAGLMDVSGLKKLHLVGPHASAVLNYATTRDVTEDLSGKIRLRLHAERRRTFHRGLHPVPHRPEFLDGGARQRRRTRNAGQIRRRPQRRHDRRRRSARSFAAGTGGGRFSGQACARHPRPQIFSSHAGARCSAVPSTISRTGYTGERGYEIFCKGEDAGLIWDTILSEGRSFGIIPACFTTLDYLRVESSLLFYPYDMSQMYPFEKDPPGDSLWELGLDFTVSPGKNDFNGADAHARLKGKERFKIFGLLVDGKSPADMGDLVYSGDKKVGVVTCAMVSTLTAQVDGHRASRRPGRRSRNAPGDPRQECQRPRDGAHSAVRRRGQEKAHGGWLTCKPNCSSMES